LKKYTLLFLSLVTALLLINVFILINRNKGFKYFPFKSYSQLYVTDSTLYLHDVHFNNDTVDLLFSLKLPSTNYTLIIDDTINNGLIRPDNYLLHIPLLNNIHAYRLLPADKTQLEIAIQIDHSKNTDSNYTNEFMYCNLAGPQIEVSDYSIWTKGISSLRPDEVENGRQLLAKNTSALSATTDSARLIEVCKLISTLRPNAQGIKASAVSMDPAYDQLKSAMQNKINLDCGNYSVMLHYLCNVLSLPNRIITFSGPAGNWQYGVHYYNEVYLREKQQWVLCDGVSNAYMPHDSVRFYNAADVHKMAHVNGLKNKFVFTFKENNLQKVSYDSFSYWHWYYNRNNANLCYLHPGAGVQDGKWNYLKDFYSFNRNFDFYSDINQNDWIKIIIKMMAFYPVLGVVLAYFGWKIKTFRKTPKS
jgi:hypothetical protein